VETRSAAAPQITGARRLVEIDDVQFHASMREWSVEKSRREFRASAG